MTFERIQFQNSSLCHWAGMGDFELVSPDGNHVLGLIYEGEPPHGDSYHKAIIDGQDFPGYVWGCMFSFSSCSRYLAFSAMRQKWERATVVVDLEKGRYFVLPEYIHQLEIDWPSVIGNGSSSKGKMFTFKGDEKWLAF